MNLLTQKVFPKLQKFDPNRPFEHHHRVPTSRLRLTTTPWLLIALQIFSSDEFRSHSQWPGLPNPQKHRTNHIDETLKKKTEKSWSHEALGKTYLDLNLLRKTCVFRKMCVYMFPCPMLTVPKKYVNTTVFQAHVYQNKINKMNLVHFWVFFVWANSICMVVCLPYVKVVSGLWERHLPHSLPTFNRQIHAPW